MAPNAPSATVFVVDDDQGLSRLIHKALQREGFRVATALSGQQAITWLGSNRADLMLLDLKLRDIEAKELVNHLNSIQRAVPFIIITGQGDERVAVEMMKRGALDYLVKDVDFLQFVPEVVRRALGQLTKARRLAEAEEALRLSESNLANAQQIAHVGSYELILPRADKLHWSSETYRILGVEPSGQNYSFEEYVNRLVHPEDRSRVRAALQRSVSETAPYNIEYRIVRPDGSIRHVHSVAELLPEPDKKGIKLVGTLRDVTERKELEKEIRQISEREQRRIGQDLHDGLGQQLTAIELMCESLRSDLASEKSALEPQAAQVCRFLREAIGQTRTLAYGLVAFKVQTGGLQTALMELAQATSALAHLKCRLECPFPVELEDNEVAAHLYRIAQEAVNNAVKHSHGSKVIIQLSQSNGVLRLQVIDNGKGLSKTKRPGQSMGLQVMKHRANVVGADLEVVSRSGKGVTVSCELRIDK